MRNGAEPNFTQAADDPSAFTSPRFLKCSKSNRKFWNDYKIRTAEFFYLIYFTTPACSFLVSLSDLIFNRTLAAASLNVRTRLISLAGWPPFYIFIICRQMQGDLWQCARSCETRTMSQACYYSFICSYSICNDWKATAPTLWSESALWGFFFNLKLTRKSNVVNLFS